MPQLIIDEPNSISALPNILKQLNIKKLMVVTGSSYKKFAVSKFIASCLPPHFFFSGFSPNPQYEDVKSGTEFFNTKGADAILAIGGGSAIDTAKCIKLFCRMKNNTNYLRQKFSDSGIPVIAIPSTAGSGSESTMHAVVYYKGEKQSISHPSLIPDYAILEPSLLETLPAYQKKSAMLDALCQGIESWWSVKSTEESRYYSHCAVSGIMENYQAYIHSSNALAARQIMRAANCSGKAINLAMTTAPHAMSYKLASMYRISHGHAAALCLPAVWKCMLSRFHQCADQRGAEYLQKIFHNISRTMKCRNPQEAITVFHGMLSKLDISTPSPAKETDMEELAKAVNQTRLKNNPVTLNSTDIMNLYKNILGRK